MHGPGFAPAIVAVEKSEPKSIVDTEMQLRLFAQQP
jgi:hypothetical protein